MSKKLKKLSREGAKNQLNEIIKLFHKSVWASDIKKKIKNKKGNIGSDSLQELIDYLRVCIKYTLLDVESLKRERDYFKKLLEDNGIKL